MVPYQNAGFELKFLGTMNGESNSHTNAYFYPEQDVLAFIDLSLLNYEKATRLITPNLKRVILFLTHLHVDHVSGVLSLAFLVRSMLHGVLLEVVTGSYFTREAFHCFYAMGGKPIARNGKYDEVLRIYGQRRDGKIVSRITPETDFIVEQDFLFAERHFETPDWLIQTVPTVHSPRLPGAVGFVFKINGKAIIFSGDTNTTLPFFPIAESCALEANGRLPIPTELYIEAQVGAAVPPTHLSFAAMRGELLEIMRRIPTLRVVLMHYNDRERLEAEVETFNSALDEDRLFIATTEK